uniref:Uncharacterized protein n=1 Tax=Rhizochromulina marina TaxID=1034831 RepID=A0A7S2SHG2_9STRA
MTSRRRPAARAPPKLSSRGRSLKDVLKSTRQEPVEGGEEHKEQPQLAPLPAPPMTSPGSPVNHFIMQDLQDELAQDFDPLQKEQEVRRQVLDMSAAGDAEALEQWLEVLTSMAPSPGSGEEARPESKKLLLFTDEDGRTGVYLAAASGHLKALDLLLDYGGSATARNRHGTSPLHAAAWGGHVKAVQRLLDAEDIDLNAETIHGHRPLHFACFQGNLQVLHLLLDWKPQLAGLVRDGQDDAVKSERQVEPAQVNAADNTGETPLHVAAANGRLRAIGMLLWHGADPRRPDYRNDVTPTGVAMRRGQIPVVLLLFSYGVFRTVASVFTIRRRNLALRSSIGAIISFGSALAVFNIRKAHDL